MRLLAARDRSEHEIRVHLAGHPPDTLEAVLARLRHFGYVDDDRFAGALCERLARRGFGSERARHELAEHRVAHETISAAVAEMVAGDSDRARHLLARRFPDLGTAPRERARAARFLTSRGYPEAVVTGIVGGDPDPLGS